MTGCGQLWDVEHCKEYLLKWADQNGQAADMKKWAAACEKQRPEATDMLFTGIVMTLVGIGVLGSFFALYWFTSHDDKGPDGVGCVLLLLLI